MIPTHNLRWVNRITHKDGRMTGQSVLQQWNKDEYKYETYQGHGGLWVDVELTDESPDNPELR